MSNTVTIYCEGTKGSHDYDILSKVIDDITPRPTVVPIGSVRSAGAVIQYINAQRKGVMGDKSPYLLFRDRDFDREWPPTVSLEQDTEKNYVYYSYRNTIENYLFDPNLFHQFIAAENIDAQHGIFSPEDARQCFIQAATTIRCYQAVRLTMGEMRENTNFGTKLTKESGKLPNDLSEDACKQDALRRIMEAKAATNGWTAEAFEAIYQRNLAKFDATFMQNLEFLVYFQGKDFTSALSQVLPKFPIKPYFKYAKTHFDFRLFPDLVALNQVISNLTQKAP